MEYNHRDSLKEIYVYNNVLNGAIDHCISYNNLEAIGLLLGKRYKHSGKEYIVILDQIEVKSKSSHTFVEFDEKAFSYIGSVLRSERHRENFFVGWYHSHPDFGCWLSSVDIKTQATYFNENYHCALVIDPIRKYLKFFKLLEGKRDYRAVEFCTVYEGRWQCEGCYNGRNQFKF
ncbi:MAG: Mov34/MPN/PAD-1 family protein [Candidatus Thorarchaeota archaeon]|jgi:proteasome lid subunit RPN8/RPN11